MKTKKCKECQRNMPSGYQYKYCDHCRNKQVKKYKDGAKWLFGLACIAFGIGTAKGRFGQNK